jgi:hypothetical protein
MIVIFFFNGTRNIFVHILKLILYSYFDLWMVLLWRLIFWNFSTIFLFSTAHWLLHPPPLITFSSLPTESNWYSWLTPTFFQTTLIRNSKLLFMCARIAWTVCHIFYWRGCTGHNEKTHDLFYLARYPHLSPSTMKANINYYLNFIIYFKTNQYEKVMCC